MNLDGQREVIEQGLEELSLSYADSQIDALMKYGELLYEENAKLNLTRIPAERFALDHILDSLAAAKVFIDESVTSLIDLGTGAGLPGIPIKIFWPNIKIELVEAREKKIGFLEKVIRRLGLEGVNAHHVRAEDLAHKEEYREQYDLVCARALADMSVYLELAVGFIKLGGKVVALKSDSSREEMLKAQPVAKTLGCAAIEIAKYKIPGSEIDRDIAWVTKINKTDSAYPRSIKKINSTQLA